MSAEGEGCLKSFPIPVRESLVVNGVVRIRSSTDTTYNILVNGEGKSSCPRIMAVNTWC
jgi:hypothetical protein